MKYKTFYFCILFIVSILFYAGIMLYLVKPYKINTDTISYNKVQHKTKVTKEIKHTTSQNTSSQNSTSNNTVSDNIYSNLTLGEISPDVTLDYNKVAPAGTKVYSVSDNNYKPGNYWFVCKPGKRGDIVVYSQHQLYKLTIDGVHNYTDVQVFLDDTSFYYVANDFDVKLKTSISEQAHQPNYTAY